MPPKKRKKTVKAKRSKDAQVILPSVRLYRQIAALFLIVTVGMLSVVLYLATVKAEVRVETTEGDVSAEFLGSVVTEPQGNEDIPGVLFEETIEETKVFEVRGEGSEIPANAHGIVTLTNETGSAQPLVTTTRLLSEDGVLFRITDGVTVPAQGTVQVEARADEAGRSGEVPAGRFTVPGLSESKQSAIYATTDSPMVGGTEVRRIVTAEDLELAQAELVTDIENALDIKWREGLTGQLDGVLFKTETLEKRSDTEPDTETGSFTISTIVKVTGVYYDSQRLARIADAKLREHVASGQVLSKDSGSEMLVSLEGADVELGTARLRVTVDGKAVLQTTSDLLDRDNLIGLTAPEAEAFLEENETIRNAEIELFPFWVSRIPRLKDHIYIEIVNIQ